MGRKIEFGKVIKIGLGVLAGLLMVGTCNTWLLNDFGREGPFPLGTCLKLTAQNSAILRIDGVSKFKHTYFTTVLKAGRFPGTEDVLDVSKGISLTYNQIKNSSDVTAIPCP